MPPDPAISVLSSWWLRKRLPRRRRKGRRRISNRCNDVNYSEKEREIKRVKNYLSSGRKNEGPGGGKGMKGTRLRSTPLTDTLGWWEAGSPQLLQMTGKIWSTLALCAWRPEGALAWWPRRCFPFPSQQAPPASIRAFPACLPWGQSRHPPTALFALLHQQSPQTLQNQGEWIGHILYRQ